MLGATNPLASAPGTIRGDYAIVWSLVRVSQPCHLCLYNVTVIVSSLLLGYDNWHYLFSSMQTKSKIASSATNLESHVAQLRNARKNYFLFFGTCMLVGTLFLQGLINGRDLQSTPPPSLPFSCRSRREDDANAGHQ